jgi:geranylgeranyl pyrophosphate synthase
LPDHIDEALSWAEEFALSQASVERQRKILQIAFEALRTKEGGFSVFIHFPLLVYSLFREDLKRAVPLAGLTTLFYTGVDLFDDVADGDLPADAWRGVTSGEVNLAASSLFFSLPMLAIENLQASKNTKSRMRVVLAQGFLEMVSGQHVDLFCAGAENVSPDKIENSVIAKAGGELAFFARLAALLAEAPAEVEEICAKMGRSYGTALQLTSDVHDIFFAPWSRDLASGARTMPIALHLDILEEAEQKDFVVLMDQARTDRHAQEAVRERLIADGVLRKMAMIIEIYCGEALNYLEKINSMSPATAALRAQISSASLSVERE